MVQKGIVAATQNGGATVSVMPYSGGSMTTHITVPQSLWGNLPVGTPVVYAVFEDCTGIVLARMDGVGS